MTCKRCGAVTASENGICEVCAGMPPYLNDWDSLESACKSCRKCPLGADKTNTVFGCGNRQATLMFVGESPGEKEDLSGVPFVGAAGKLFDRYLCFLGIDRQQVYIANILKCRPPRNRDPKPEEQDCCIDFLRNQVRLIRPEIIVCLGRIAAMRLIEPNYRITREHGQWVERNGMKLTAVYHPSLLLRDADVKKRQEMMTDLESIRDEWLKCRNRKTET